MKKFWYSILYRFMSKDQWKQICPHAWGISWRLNESGHEKPYCIRCGSFIGLSKIEVWGYTTHEEMKRRRN